MLDDPYEPNIELFLRVLETRQSGTVLRNSVNKVAGQRSSTEYIENCTSSGCIGIRSEPSAQNVESSLRNSRAANSVRVFLKK